MHLPLFVPPFLPYDVVAQHIGKLHDFLVRRAAGIAPNTMTKLNRDEEVTLETLGKICAILNVNIGDIVDFLPTNQTTEVNLETK